MTINTNLSGFDIVVIEVEGSVSLTTCYKNYSDYIKDKQISEGDCGTLNIDLSSWVKQGENK